MKRKDQKIYGPDGQYYRKLVKNNKGGYDAVYGKTKAERDEKVIIRLNELAAEARQLEQPLYFYEYAARWYKNRAPHLSPDMRKLYESQINKIICPVIGGKLLAEINSDDIAAVMATRGHLSRSSQKKTVMVIRQIFDAADEAGLISRPPTRKLKAEGPPPQKKRALTQSQQRLLLEAVKGLAIEPFVVLGLYTGMRREEICGLRWDCVDLSNEAPHIEVLRACRWPDHTHPEVNEVLKTSAAYRTIPIPPQLVTYLKDLKSATPGTEAAKRRKYVFNSDGGPVSYSTMRRRWDTIRSRSTVSGRELGEKVPRHKVTVTMDFDVTPHILRHTYITTLILGGMDLKRVQYLAGHSDPKVTLQIYTDLMGHAPAELIGDVRAIFLEE